MTLVYESSARSPVHSGITTASASAGNILALVILYFLSKYLSKEEISLWGWRIPFLLGGFLALICYFLRQNLQETEEYLAVKKEVSGQVFFHPLKTIFSSDFRAVFFGTILSISIASLLVIFIYIPTYITRFFQYSAESVYLAITIALVFSLALAPIAGIAAKKLGKRKVIFLSAVLLAISGCFMFNLLNFGTLSALIIFALIYEFFLTTLYVASLALLADLFSVKVRNTALSFCYNVGYAVASMSPVLVSFLIEKTGYGKSILVVFICVLASLMMLSIVMLWRRRDMRNEYD